jgi:hypothetical protein
MELRTTFPPHPRCRLAGAADSVYHGLVDQGEKNTLFHGTLWQMMKEEEMRKHASRPTGGRTAAALAAPVLLLALAALAFPAREALAGYAFTGGGTTTGTATGDSAVTNLYLVEFSGIVYHSTDGIVFSPDWGGGLTIGASATNTINVSVSSGDGSTVQLGHTALSPASDLLVQLNLVAVANTADTVLIEDSTNASTGVTYTIDTGPGTITAPGLNFNQGASAAFQGGVTLKGGTGGDTFNVTSLCCSSSNHEPVTLVGGTGNDTFFVSHSGTLVIPSNLFVSDAGGGGSLVVDDSADATARTVTIGSSQITGASAGAINFGTGITSITFNGGTAADTFLVTPNPTAPITVAGGLPSTCPGDALTVDLSGVTAPIVSTPGAVGAGQITFGNRSPVIYTGIESLTPTTASVGATQAICAAGTTTGLGGNTPIIGTGMWSIVSGGTGTFNPDALTPDATFTQTSGAGPITLRWTIASPPCAASSADVAITINPSPATPIAGNTGPYAVGQTITLTASTVPGATYSWTGPLGFASTQQNPTIANATTAMSGTYSVTAIIGDCTSAAATTAVSVTVPIPALSGLGLLALALVLAACGVLLLGRRASS